MRVVQLPKKFLPSKDTQDPLPNLVKPLLGLQSQESHFGGRISSPDKPMWNLWLKKLHRTSFSLSTPVFPCQYHSAKDACLYIV